jgi:DUF1016 N-terminal domain
MIRFAREYDVSVILQQPVAKLAEPVESSAIIPQSSCPRIVQDLLAQIPWGHNILLMEKFKDLPTRLWYAQQTIVNGLRLGGACRKVFVGTRARIFVCGAAIFAQCQ